VKFTGKKLVAGLATIAGVVALSAAPALAQEEVTGVLTEETLSAEAVQVVLDNIWVLIAAILVIFMQAGFALVEAGLTRAKSVANIMMKNLMDFAVGVLVFAAVGFAFAFGEGNGFIGTEGWFLNSETFSAGWLNLSLPTFFIFQVAFAATAATIVSGAMAERTKFKAYFIYSALITAIVYPIIVHWVWGGGWLSTLGTPYHDFAGSGVVHTTGGIAALVGTAILGPRIGKYAADGTPRAIPGHSIPFAIIGCFILLIGWFGFNPGSELAADSAVPAIAVTTLLAGVAGALIATLVTWFKDGKPDVAMAGNGLLAGLVGITAGCAALNNWSAVIVGAIAGALVVGSVYFFDRIRIDDPVGAISVHGICGIWGVIAVGLFAAEESDYWKQGLFFGGGTDQLLSQLLGIAAIVAFTAVAMTIVFMAIKYTIGLRVSPTEEVEGLDVHEHGYAGYGVDVVTGFSDEVLIGSTGSPSGKQV
jgi:Amt family ammonium transporter